MFKIFLLIISAFVMKNSYAHPVQFKDAVAIMTWNQPFANDSWLTYSHSPKMALAFRHMRVLTNMNEVNHFYMPQYNFLLKRWNGENFQGNIYVYGGAGVQNRPDRNGAAVLGGVQADWETRKYYVSGKAELMGSNVDSGMEKYEARIGIAPYESEYDEIGSWFMLQYQSHTWLAKKQVLTPLARFMYKTVLWETGVSFEGDYMLNFMFHF